MSNLTLSSDVNTTIGASAVTTISGAAYIRMNGNVGLGTTPSFQLHLSSNSAAKPTSSTWTVTSDRRLKKNIHPLRGTLAQLLQLRGVTYQWKEPETQGNMTGTYPGFIAQDVEPVFPDWVGTDPSGYKNVTAIGFEALVVEALRELRAEQDAEREALREEIRALRAHIERLEGSNAQAAIQASVRE